MLDIAGSFIFGGLLLIMSLKLNFYTSDYDHQSTFDLRSQKNSVLAANIIKDDLSKIGFGDKSGMPIRIADTSKIRFYADIDNNGTVDSITYNTAPLTAAYAKNNPHHQLLYRTINASSPIIMNIGITSLKLTYYDSSGTLTGSLKKIKAVKLSMKFESDVKSVGAGGKDSVYNTTHLQQYIVPKALHF